MTQTVRFKPMNLGRWLVWGLTGLLFLALPLIFKSSFTITLMTQMGTFIIFALSYNMLLGQSGMLSFGHAVYSGLGAFFAIHALNWIGAGTLHFPVTLLPLIGGLAGAFFGVLFGYVTTKKSGTPFAMITLGIGEMVFAASLMFPGFFGGEGGITTNRTASGSFMGITYGPGIQVYYLVAAWTFISMVAMYAFTHTPLGRLANAVRDNPERVEFVGYDTQQVRYLVLILSGFFAGISGGLSAINFEIVSAENVSALRSGGVLFATFIGGALIFFGPILGAVLFTFFVVALSDYTKAWQLYLGLVFVLIVMYAPGGLASLLLMNLRVAKFKRFRPLAKPYAAVIASGLVLLVGVIMVIELSYHLTLESTGNATMTRVFGVEMDAAGLMPWAAAFGFTVAGTWLFWITRLAFAKVWGRQQELIEEDIARGAA